jgi:hypothetical protein
VASGEGMLEAVEGVTMTEAEWLGSTDPEAMLSVLQRKAMDRKLRLFSVACCRRIWHLLANEQNRKAVEVAERYSDGLASLSDLIAARSESREPARSTADAATNAVVAAQDVARRAASAAGEDRIARTISGAVEKGERVGNFRDWQIQRGAEAIEAKAQASPLRDIFGPLPFRPVVAQPQRPASSASGSTVCSVFASPPLRRTTNTGRRARRSLNDSGPVRVS